MSSTAHFTEYPLVFPILDFEKAVTISDSRLLNQPNTVMIDVQIQTGVVRCRYRDVAHFVQHIAFQYNDAMLSYDSMACDDNRSLSIFHITKRR